MNRRTLMLALAGAACSTNAALAQELLGFGDTGQGDFRTMDLMGGEFAIQTSQIALERSRDPRVRQFAQFEIEEQTAVAAALGTAPGGVPLRSDQAAIIAQLQAASGRRFEAIYIRGQIAGHEELLALNSSYAQSGDDPRVRSVAVLSVPTIRTHLAILGGLRSRV